MSRAWFALAVAGVLGLFYVGYAMGQAGGGGLGVDLRPPASEKLKWEVVNGRAPYPPMVMRSKVPGGWLVETNRRGGEWGTGSGLAFVPDPDHKWDGTSLP